MKKQWEKPELEVLEVKMTMTKWHDWDPPWEHKHDDHCGHDGALDS